MALDLVQIGFEVQAKGLDEANQKTDKLIDKFGGVGEAGEKAAARFEKAQERLRSSIQKTEKTVEYMNKGFSSSVASKSAAFKIAGVSDSDIQAFQNSMKSLEAAKQRASAASGGFSSLSESLASLSGTAKQTQSSFDSLLSTAANITKFSIISTAVYALINSFTSLTSAMITMADEYTAVQNRLKLYIKDSETLASVNQFLAKTAIQNNVGLRENAALYAKLSPAMQRIGANTAATKTVVDAFGKSLRVGGATIREAEAATIQFAQAMASGKLAGDEFRSISEASPRFLKAIADGSGIAAERLKEMSAAGMLTTEVIARALVKEYGNLKKESESLGYTLEQGTNALKVGFMSLVGEFNEGAGITRALGTALAEVGFKMLDGAKSAKEFGQNVSSWFKQNIGIIQAVGEAVKALAIVFVSRYVASVILARLETARYQATLLSMAAAQAGVTRSSILMSTAITGVGNAMKGALAFFGGWAGLAVTIASVAASYFLLNKASSDTTSLLRKEGESVEAAVEKYKQLSEVKQKEAITKEKESLSELTQAYNEQKQALVTNVVNLSRHNDMTTAQAQSLSKLALRYKEGQISLTQLSKEVNNSNLLSQESKNKFNLMAGSVVDAGDKANSSAKLLKLLGIETKTVGDEAVIAGLKMNKMAEDFQKAAAKNRLTLSTMRQYNLDQSVAGKVVDAAVAKYENPTGSLGKALDSAKRWQEELNERKKRGLDISKQQAELDRVNALNEKTRQTLISKEIKSQVPAAQEFQESTDAISDYEAALRKAEKESKQTNPFAEQSTQLRYMLALISKGSSLEVAKVASQKDYIKWYGTNLAMAKEIVALEEKRKAIEDARQKQQQEKEKKKQFGEDIEKQLKNAQELSKFIKAGFNMDVSSPVVDAGFKADANGFKMVGNVMTANLTKQAVALQGSVRLTEHLLELSRSGRDLDEVKLKQQIYTNSKLSDEVKLHQYNLVMGIIEAQKYADLKEAQLNLQTESNAALKEAAVYAQYQNNELAAIAAKYKLIDEASVSEHKVRQNILEKVKEQNEYLKQQKENPFANVDFEVFGDFGNPFKSALDGLNSLLTAVPDLEDKYKSMFASLDEKTKLAAGNKEELAKIDATRASLEAQYIVDNKKLQDKSITGTLSLAKSFFKENSKGYKIVSGLEKAYQASKIAFALWEKKDYIATLGMKIIGHAQEAAAFVMGSTTKIAAQSAQNVVQAQGAVASAANAPPPVGFAAAAAMIALLAGIGIAIGGGSSGSFAPTNEGTGTVFGDKEAKSESIKKSIDLLADNSRVELPLTAAMLKSLRNIENNIGGLTNLLIRNPPAEGLAASIGQGFKMDGIGKGITGAFDWVNKLTFGLADMFTLGLFSAFGKLLGGAFGKKVSIKGQGLYGGSQDLGGIVTDGFNLQEYVDIQTKKKSFGITTSTKNSTRYSKADQELANQFGLIFKNFYDTILMAASPLDQNLNEVTTKLNNFVVEIGKINLQGLNGEQIQEKLNAVFGAAADNIARAAVEGLDDFQKVGEGYFETLVRVASGIESANAYTSRLNVTAIKYTDIINKQGDITVEIIRQSVLLAEGYKGIAGGFYDMVDAFDGGANELVDFVLQLRDLQDAIYATGKSGDYLTTSMFLGAGGLDRLSNGLEAYFEMLSPAEQAAELTRRLTNEFAIFGLQLPADIKAFRNLVNGIDISTESGQKLYGQVIALAPEFNDLQDSLENANSAVNDLVKSLRDLAEEARKARGETQQPRNLASIRSEFDATAALAMQGDMTAAQKLLTLGKDLMQVSKQYSVSGSEYAKDLATIQKVATVSADVQELGLGYTPTTSLTPLASAGTQTVETVNSTTDAKLEALRADLITAITAVAKYTQDTAQRLQRWDYGDKMNVHVEQEVGDSPIKVQTV